MSYNVQEKMTDKQKEIYGKYNKTFPFKVVDFINELGIKVVAAEMQSYVSGAIVAEKDEQYKIYVNDSHPASRIRFTLAHELGHYFNDKDYLNDKGEIIDPSKQSHDKILWRKDVPVIDEAMRIKDIKANQFAAELLMPQDKFIEVWNNNTSPEAVAKFFNVSKEAVQIRAAALLGEIF